MPDRFIDDEGNEVEIRSAVELLELIEEGTIRPATLVFHDAEGRWVPARELPGYPAENVGQGASRSQDGAAGSAVNTRSAGARHDTSRTTATPPHVAREPHPWRRYWARIVDTSIAGFVGAILLLVFRTEYFFESTGAEYLATLVGLIQWMLIETWLLKKFGTTPGKKLMNIRIRSADGRPVRTRQAFNRSVGVWLRGLGCGLPVVSAITMLVGYSKLQKYGESTWDRDSGTRVIHGPVGPGRWMLLILFLTVLLALSIPYA